MSRWRPILAYFLLAAFVLIVALYARSYAYRDVVWRSGIWRFTSDRGVVQIHLNGYRGPTAVSFANNGWQWEPYEVRDNRVGIINQVLGFGYQASTTRLSSHLIDSRIITFPHWVVALVLGLLFIWARPRPKFRFGLGEFALVVTGFTLLLGFAS